MPKPPDTPKPAAGEPTRPVPDAGRLAEEADDFDWNDPWADPKDHVTLPMGTIPEEFAAATVQPPTRPALRRTATDSGLGVGVPGPSFGGDTDFNAMDTAESPALPESQRITLLSDPPAQLLDLSLEEPPDGDEALDLVHRQGDSVTDLGPTKEPPRAADPMSELRERYALGDFSGALTVAESLLEDDADNADVQRYAASCRDVLQQMYMARLGALDQIPVVAVPAEQLRWLTLDHRAGFLLSHVDGVSTLEEILDISGMPHLEAMRLIYELLQQKVIVFQ